MENDCGHSVRHVGCPVCARPEGLTRQDIEELRADIESAHQDDVEALCAMALRSITLEQALRNICERADEMLAPLGYHGHIYAKDDRVHALMSALDALRALATPTPTGAPK